MKNKGVAMFIKQRNRSNPNLGSQADSMTTSYAQIRIKLLIKVLRLISEASPGRSGDGIVLNIPTKDQAPNAPFSGVVRLLGWFKWANPRSASILVLS